MQLFRNVDTASDSASMAMSALARRLQEQGTAVINLSVGDTHFPPPPVIQQRLREGVAEYTHYTDAAGLPLLRKSIAEHYYPGRYQPEDILIVPGVKQGLFYLLSVLDVETVCILEPAWLGYQHTAVLAGKKVVTVQVEGEHWLQKLAKTPFDVLILCSPNNPDGRLFSGKEIQTMVAAAAAQGAYVVCDEIYAAFSYDAPAVSASAVSDYARLCICNGFSKSLAMTGLRLGFLAIQDTALRRNILTIQQHVATCPSTLAQFAALGFPDAAGDTATYVDYYRKNRDMVSDMLPEFAPHKPAGGFYYFVDLGPFGISDGTAFAHDFLEKAHTAVVPGVAYGNAYGRWIRFSIAVPHEQLREGMQRLQSFLQA